ncbi:MAG TPA: glycosyltransferase family 4 protein [Ignavibacteria bacterium]
MKVLFIGRYNDSEIFSGPEKVANRIFYQHTLKEHSYFLEYFFEGNLYLYFQKLFGKKIIKKVNKGLVVKLGIFRLILFLFKEKPEIIHIITFERFALVVFLYKIFFKVKIIFNVHGVVQYENKYFYPVSKFLAKRNVICEKKFINKSDALLIFSDESRKKLLEYYPVHHDKFFNIQNGIDMIFKDKFQVRKYKNDRLLKAVFTSSIEIKIKGFEKLYKCLLVLKIPLHIFVISNRNENVEQYNNRYIKFEVINTMVSEEYANFLSDIDLIFAPSIFDTFPINIIENMASGVIPLISKDNGVSRLITNEKNGFIIDFVNTDKFVSILQKLSEDFEYRKKISENASGIYEILSWDKIYKQYENVYSKFINQ